MFKRFQPHPIVWAVVLSLLIWAFIIMFISGTVSLIIS